MGAVRLHQGLGRAHPGQDIAFAGQIGAGDVRMRRGLPAFLQHGARTAGGAEVAQLRRIGQGSRGEARLGLEGALLQLRLSGRGLLLFRCGQGQGGFGKARRPQRQRLAPVMRAHGEQRPLLPHPGSAGLGRLGLAGQALRLGPVLPLHGGAQQPAQAQEAGVLALGQGLEGSVGRLLPPAHALRLGGQQQGVRRVPQQLAGAADLHPRLVGRAGGQRHQGAGHGGIAFRAVAHGASVTDALRPGAQQRPAPQQPVQHHEADHEDQQKDPERQADEDIAHPHLDRAAQVAQVPGEGDADREDDQQPDGAKHQPAPPLRSADRLRSAVCAASSPWA